MDLNKLKDLDDDNLEMLKDIIMFGIEPFLEHYKMEVLTNDFLTNNDFIAFFNEVKELLSYLDIVDLKLKGIKKYEM